MIGNLWCENCTCKAVGKEKKFEIEINKESEKVLCPNNKKLILKLLGTKVSYGTIIASKHKNGRTPKEKYLRRTDDFIKNTLPRMGGEEKVHFNKKFGMVKGKRTK